MLAEGTKKEIMEALPPILSPREVAQFLKISSITVWRMIRDKQLPSYRADGETCILRDDLIKYLSRHSNL